MDTLPPDTGLSHSPAALSQEVAKIRDSALFRRSPVLSGLLQYLLEQTLINGTVTSFSVAIDGLGSRYRPEGDLDTYARVTVARLRKTLKAYYADNESTCHLTVENGSYRLGIAGTVFPSDSDETEYQSGRGKSVYFKVKSVFRKNLKLISAGVSASAIIFSYTTWKNDASFWTSYHHIPTISVYANDIKSDNRNIGRVASRMRTVAQQYYGFRVINKDDVSADFSLIIDNNNADNRFVNIIAISNSSGDIIMSDDIKTEDYADLNISIENYLINLLSPNGRLNQFLLSSESIDPMNPRGCWFSFLKDMRGFFSAGSPGTQECAETWYRLAPGDPLSAVVRGWTLIDRAALATNSFERAVAFNEGVDVLRKAVALAPDHAFLQVAYMRAMSFYGDRDEAIAAAKRAIAAAPNNLHIKGTAGVVLAVWQDPQADEVLSYVASGPGNRYPWVFSGKFVLAMMRDDVAAAGKAVENVKRFDTGQPFVNIIVAAYDSKIGREDLAEARIKKLQSSGRLKGRSVESIIQMLPMSPEVERRLRSWLGGSILMM